MRALATVLLMAIAATAWGEEPAPAASPAGLTLDEVVIRTEGGAELRFTVELAVTPDQQRHGLMFREEMAMDEGMLFLFDTVQPRSFWMRNTLISLDMLFIAPDGRILNIAERTVPQTDDSHPSAGPASAVLEINGGLSALLGISAGDLVLHDAFGTGAEPAAERGG